MKDCSHEPNMMIGDYHPSFQTIAASAALLPGKAIISVGIHLRVDPTKNCL